MENEITTSDTSYSERLSFCTSCSTFSSFRTFLMNKERTIVLPDGLHFALVELQRTSLFRINLNKYKTKFNSIFTWIRKEYLEQLDRYSHAPPQCL